MSASNGASRRRGRPQGDSGGPQSPEISSSSDFSPVYSNYRAPSTLNQYHFQYPRRNPLYSHLERTVNIPAKNELSTFKALSAVAVIFACSVLALVYLYSKFPDLEEEEKKHIKIPMDIEDAKQLGMVLDRYKEKYLYEVMSGVFLVYIFLQSFAIPGSMFLSILSGFLFPFVAALLLVCTCSAIGASLCFLLSHLLGKKFVKKYCPERAAKWAVAIEKNKEHLLYYMIFLRVTPFLPNWFINLTAPIIGVPLVPFALGTFIGVAPPSFVAIQAGQTLHTLTSSSDAWSWTSVIILSVFAVVSLIPVILKNKLKEKFE